MIFNLYNLLIQILIKNLVYSIKNTDINHFYENKLSLNLKLDKKNNYEKNSSNTLIFNTNFN